MIVNFFGQDIARRRRVGGIRFLTAGLSLPKLQHYRSRFPVSEDADEFTVKL